MKAAGICGTDVELYTGEMKLFKTGGGEPPFILGHEWTGIVEEIGKGVTRFKPGDRVTGEPPVGCMVCEICRSGHYNLCKEVKRTGFGDRDGAFAEYIVFPERHLYSLGNIPLDSGVLVETATVGLMSCVVGEIGPFDNILVTGPGPIGLMAAQIAKKVLDCWEGHL